MERDCRDAVATPLPEVPENKWPSTLADGLAAIDQLWSQPLSAQLQCPEGLVASKGPVVFNDVAFDFRMEDAQSFALVDSSNKALPVPGTPDSIAVDLSIHYDHALYGKSLLRHPTGNTSGTDEVCVMTNLQMMQ